MCRVVPLVAMSVGLGWLSATLAPAQEWTRFRGPNGSGVAAVATTWTESDRAWKTKLPGKGHAAPIAWGTKLFVTSGDPMSGQRTVHCLDLASGAIAWTRAVPVAKHRHHDDNRLASGSPAVDDRHVYVPWASPADYLVVALDHAGREQWRVDLGPFKSGHGFGASLIVHDGMVIVPFEHEGKSSIVALDRDTGKTRWQLPRRSRTTYATPCVRRDNELIFGNYEHGLTSVDPRTGKIHWELDVFNKGHVETTIASPLLAGDLVIGCSGWLGVRKEVIAVRPPKDGAPARVVYTLTRGTPLVPTPLVKDGLLYLWDDDGVVTCADATTGKYHWQERVEGTYYGSPIAVGSRLLNVSRAGDVVFLAAGQRFEEIQRFSLGEGSFSTPAVVGKMLIVRAFQHVHGFLGK